MKTLIHIALLFLLVLGSPYWVGSGSDDASDSLPH